MVVQPTPSTVFGLGIQGRTHGGASEDGSPARIQDFEVPVYAEGDGNSAANGEQVGSNESEPKALSER